MKENVRTILFAFVLSVVAAGLLTGMKVMTSSRQEANKLAYKRENILRILAIDMPGEPTAEQVNSLFEANIVAGQMSGSEVFKYVADGKVLAVVVPFEGPGLWNKIKGYLVLDENMTTIKGITFYEHEETPGLGGEIEQKWFRKQFEGKPFKDASGNLAIKIVKPGMKKNDNDIDGITGATITGDKVQAMLENVAKIK